MRTSNRTLWRTSLLGIALIGSLLGVAMIGRSAPQGDNHIGRKIDNFTLEDYRGRKRSLSDWSDSKLVVVAFLGTECPLANLYLPRMSELAAKFESQGVAFIAINSNQQDAITDVASHAQRHKVSFPVLKDPGNKIADQFAAERTPEVFVLDKDRVVRYWGRIDDQYGIGYQKAEANRKDLSIAVDELLAGRAVSEPQTRSIGCLIGRVHRPEPSGEVTYSNQIAAILEKRCVECHHEGQIAPFSLTDYDEVVGWAEMIQEVIHERRMPPWLAAPGHNEFKNNPSMTAEEIELVDRWVENGCPQGDANKKSAVANYEQGWGISKPDQIFHMAEKPFTIPAEGVVDYQIYEVDPGFTEDRWIKEAEVKCSNPAVTHHVIVFVQAPGEPRFGAPQMAYAPGMTPRRFDKGMAIPVAAGSKLIFQCHYTPNGTQQTDRSYVGFVYADPSEVTHEVVGGSCGEMGFTIPPNNGNYEVVARKLFLRDATLLGMNPHMHVRGKSFKYELELPDGTREVLLDVPRYDFNWQLWYMLKQPKHIPKGSKMVCTAFFDNSSENPANPDPSQEVIWGEQTWDEMMFGFYSTIRPLKQAATGAAGGN
jgi:peroxiredoxin